MNPTGNKDRKDFETICVNPRIFEYSEKTLLEEEACLSSPARISTTELGAPRDARRGS